MANNSTNLYHMYDMYSDRNLTKDELTVFFIILILILVSGVTGNILSIVIWSKGKRCSKAGSSTYFQLLAVSDLTVLLPLTAEVIDQCKFYQSYSAYYDNWLMNKNDFLCKFLSFCDSFCPQVSAWIAVALTIERTLSISFPIKFYRTNNSKRAYIVSGIIFLTSFALNAAELVLNTKVVESHPYYDRNGTASNNTYTVASCVSSPDLSQSRYISLVCFTFAVPFLVLTFCNITILFKLCKTTNLARSDSTRRQRGIKNVTQLVFGVSVLQCVSGLPVAYAYTRFTPFVSQELDFIEDNWYIFYLLARMCYYLNSSVNWVLYSLIGRDFRKDVTDMLNDCKRCCGQQLDSHETRLTSI